MVALITVALSVFLKIFSQIFQARDRARKAGEEFRLEKSVFLEFAAAEISKLRQEIADENRDIRNGEDRMDEERSRGNIDHKEN